MNRNNLSVEDLYRSCTNYCSCPDNSCIAACYPGPNQALEAQFIKPNQTTGKQQQFAGRKL